MKKIHVFTSAACNYLPKVRVLVKSIRKHHPEWVIHLALADAIMPGIDLSAEPFDEIHPLETLDIPGYRGWAFCLTIVELATAIKPFLLARLLERPDCQGVIYLDPDTVVFSPLEEVVQALGVANIALTPHLITPESSLRAIMDNEIASLKHGVYNLGFLAVAPTSVGKAFAHWWSSRTYHFCRAEIHNGLFTDQRWIDLVPAFFEGVCILRSPRLNVAPWNVTTRHVQGSLADGFTVNGDPLGFYHFTGLDSGAHRTSLGTNVAGWGSLQELVDWYQAITAELAGEPLAARPWAFGCYDDSTPIGKSARLVYRERIDLQIAYPDPFATGDNSFRHWFETQGPLEFPRLFNAETEREEQFRLSLCLTPGYQGSAVPRLDIAKVADTVGRLLADPQRIGSSLRRGIEIIKSEGFRGIARRLQ